jgi:capsular polysaccharide biosynthesis protein
MAETLGRIQTNLPVGSRAQRLLSSAKVHSPLRPLWAKHTIVIDWLRTNLTRPGTELASSRYALQRLRRLLHVPPARPESRSVLLISRAGDQLSGERSRILLNEDELVLSLRAVAADHGLRFDRFRASEETFEQTVAKFAAAKVIIGVHGAGLSNMLFSPVDCAVVELAMATPRHRDYMHLSQALDLNYWVGDVFVGNSLEKPVTANVSRVSATVAMALAVEPTRGESHSGAGGA